MQTIRRAHERGTGNFGWLNSRHTFSFGHYHDPRHMGFGPLRVINEDRVEPGYGFDSHGHRDMEIISYVLEGSLRHEDNMGNGSVIEPGDVQRMTAGTGVLHSEYNASDSEGVHFLQIWIMPERSGLEPGYEQRAFSDEEKRNRLCLVGSRDGRENSVTIHQNVDLYAGLLDAGIGLSQAIAPQRCGWLQVVSGALAANGDQLRAGDGLAIERTELLQLRASSAAEVLFFDLVG